MFETKRNCLTFLTEDTMITELEKTVINDVCKRFFVNKETLNGDSRTWDLEQYNDYVNKSKIKIDIEYSLYTIISGLFTAEIITKHNWSYHWNDELEMFIRNNKHFVLYLKQHKELLKLKNIQTDF